MTQLAFRAHHANTNPDRQLSYGSRQWDGPTEQFANQVAQFLRTAHPDMRSGDLIVWVWPHRGDDEHCRQPTPANAQEFRYPEQIGSGDPVTDTPPSLRDRIAQAIIADLKKAIPSWEPYPGAAPIGGMGRTEFDVADAVIAEVQAELESRDRELHFQLQVLHRRDAEISRLRGIIDALGAARASKEV
ncbi:hypothetical protein ACPC54_23715 [Kitasatospora sp. NPDC094028]